MVLLDAKALVITVVTKVCNCHKLSSSTRCRLLLHQTSHLCHQGSYHYQYTTNSPITLVSNNHLLDLLSQRLTTNHQLSGLITTHRSVHFASGILEVVYTHHSPPHYCYCLLCSPRTRCAHCNTEFMIVWSRAHPTKKA